MLSYGIPALKIGAPVTANQQRVAREHVVAPQVADAAWDMAVWATKVLASVPKCRISWPCGGTLAQLARAFPAPCASLNFALPGGKVQRDMFADWINQYRPALRLIQDR
jgi:hypothetical protein